MSDESDRPPELPAPLRTVSEYTGMRPDGEMHAFGLLMAGLMVVLLIPLLPVVAVVWLVSRLVDASRRTVRGDERERRGRRPAA